MTDLKKFLSSKKILIFLLLCVTVTALIFLGFVIHLTVKTSSVTNHGAKSDNSSINSRLSLSESIYTRIRYPTYYWRNDTLIYRVDNDNVIIRFENKTIKYLSVYRIPIYSNDASRVIYSLNSQSLYRHSKTAFYYVQKVNAESLEAEGKKIYVGPKMTKRSEYPLQHFSWSPSGHKCAFVYNGNLYWSSDPTRLSSAISITENIGSSNMTFGVPDWIYEEEILMNSFAYWWSPDSEHLAFLGIDEKQVATFRMYMYESVSESLYGSFMNIRYPKAGQIDIENNPIVTVYIYSTTQKKLAILKPPEQLTKLFGKNYYVEFVRWYNSSILLVGWVSRKQTLGYICSHTLLETNCKQLYNHEYSDGWINLLKQNNREPIADPSSRSLFTILPNPNSPDQFRNIAQLNIDSQSSPTWLAAEPFDVKDILQFDDTNRLLYYTMAAPLPTQSNLYCLDLKTNQSTCMSCYDEDCTTNRFSLSKFGNFLVKQCAGPNIPKTVLYAVNKDNLTKIADLLTNEMVMASFENKTLPVEKIQDFRIHIGTDNETVIYSRVIYPINFDARRKYPVVYNVYGGPFYQVVTTRFQTSWRTFLASHMNTIVIQADARGTPNRGRKFENAIYKEMGKLEIADHYAIIEEIASWNYVDKDKIGIYGASYGGFVVGHLLGLPKEHLLRCGISISPVTDFRLYDTAYTERFGGLYSENAKEYLRTNIGDLAKNFKDKELLLIHGTGDDNVHFINSAQFMKNLQTENIDFDLMVYPDEDHSISSHWKHMYKHMTRFMYDCFDKVSHRYTDLRDQDL